MPQKPRTSLSNAETEDSLRQLHGYLVKECAGKQRALSFAEAEGTLPDVIRYMKDDVERMERYALAAEYAMDYFDDVVDPERTKARLEGSLREFLEMLETAKKRAEKLSS